MELFCDGRPLDAALELPEGQLADLSATPPAGATLTLEIAGTALEPFLRPSGPEWHWRWMAPGAAGNYPLRLRATWPDGSVEDLRASLRVAPRKLDAERYAALLADLQRLGRALVLALGGGLEPAALPPEADHLPATPAEELHTLFGTELERLAAAVERLARRPPDRMRPGTEEIALGRLRDAARLREVRPERETAALDAPAPTYDSYEARLLRRLLDTLWHRLERLTSGGGLPIARAGVAIAARERLRSLRALPFLAGVPPLADYNGPTPRLQRDPDYRTVYRYWRMLRRRPLLVWDAATLSLPVAELPRLYERWCAARVALALAELAGTTLVAQAIVRLEAGEALLAVPEGEPLVVLQGPGDRRLALRYQPRYTPRGAPLRSLDRHTRVPDLALEIHRPGVSPSLLVLEAKYRLDASGGVPEDALADAYSYLGSIGTPTGARAALACALLYPGRGRPERYASGTAAIPLLPDDDAALRSWLIESLESTPGAP